MILIKTIVALQKHLKQLSVQGKEIGFVPTMGALHQGHLSLITACQQKASVTVASIFVNPAQFNDPKDFEKYPNTIEQDILALEQAGTDVLFLPSVAEIYPTGYLEQKNYLLGNLETVLEGAYRPGHFQGVCAVVEKLLQIVEPTHLFLGQKDLQQCMVLTKLVELMAIPTQIHICDTERENNGLAMSSRNLRLTAQEKENATAIYQALQYIKTNIDLQSIPDLIHQAEQILQQQHFTAIDYVAIVHTKTLQPITAWNAAEPTAALIAAYMGEVRLIDNLLIN
jgi:pantoate--beta-alanine ligase